MEIMTHVFFSLLALFICCILVVPVVCDAAQQISVPEGNLPLITLERTRCYGNCPVYSLTLYKNGTVIYVGEYYVKEEGLRIGNISTQKLEYLMDYIPSLGFFSFNDTYISYDCTDMPYAITTVRTDDKTKQVEHYYGDFSAPQNLTYLEAAIDQVVNVTQWTEPYNSWDYSYNEDLL